MATPGTSGARPTGIYGKFPALEQPEHVDYHLAGQLVFARCAGGFARFQTRRALLAKTDYFCLALLGLFWLAELLLLPFLVNRQLKKILTKLGFPNATFVVRSVTTDRADISDVSGNGIDDPTIDSAVIRFTWWKIIRGQLGEIDLTGAKVLIDPQRGIGNLGHRHHKTAAERLIPDPIEDFPFDRIVVQSSSLIIRTVDREYWIPTSGTLTHMSFDKASFSTQSQLNGAEFDVTGKFDTDHHITDMQLEADTIGLDWLIDLARSRLNMPIRGGGVAALKANFHDDPDSHRLAVVFDPHDSWVEARVDAQRLSFDRADFHIESDFGNQWEIDRFLAKGTIPRASIGEKRVRDIELSATPADSRTYLLNAKIGASLPDILPASVALHQIDLTKLSNVEVQANSMLKIAAVGSSDPPWRLDDVRLRVKLPPSEASLPAQGVTLKDVMADIPLEGTITPDAIQMSFGPQALIQVGSANITGYKITAEKPSDALINATFVKGSSVVVHRNEPGNLWSGEVGITASAQPADCSSPAGEIKGLAGVLSLAIKGDTSRVMTTILPGSLLKWDSVKSPGASADAGQIAFGGSIVQPVDQAMIVDTSLHLAKASVHLESAGCDLQDVQADIPLRWNVATTLPSDASHFAVGSVKLGSTKLPPIDGSISFNDGQLGFNVTWPILSGAVVAGQAKFAMAGSGLSGEVDFQIPEFKLSDPKALTDIFPVTKSMVVTGNLSANATIKIEGGKITPHAIVAAHSVHVESATYNAVLDDVDARIELDGFDPLSTPGDQAIYVHNARLGKLSLDNGEIHYRIENSHSILVEKTMWDFASGKLRADSFRIDPTSPTLDVDVTAENLNLKSVMDVFLPGEASGAGALYGRTPIKLRGPRILFGKGYLYSEPGPGEIQVGSATDKLADMLDASDPRFKTDETFKQVKARAVSALRNFEYDVIKMDWDSTEEGVDGTIQLSGKGKGDKGQGLNLNLNFFGLDKLLTRYLIVQKQSDSDQ